MITTILLHVFILIIIFLLLLGIKTIIRAFRSLFKLYNQGIDILPIGFETIQSLFEKDSKNYLKIF